MLLGEQVSLKLGTQIEEHIYQVINVDNNKGGILKVKEPLNIRNNGIVKAWIIQYDKNKDMYIYGNAYFGKYSISKGIGNKYIDIIKRIYTSPESITDENISTMKGMINRCLKRDQWDWFTTYEYAGYPASRFMHQFVNDCITVRNSIRNNEIDQLLIYRIKYRYIFRSMLFHLGERLDESANLDIPILGFNIKIWNKLSYDSRKNIKMADQIEKRYSIYVLMHYFVTLEHEFKRHLIEPFVKLNRFRFKDHFCYHDHFKRTHDILRGTDHCTLGSIGYLGKIIDQSEAYEYSEVILEFSNYLRTDITSFKMICKLIGNKRVNNLTLVDIRNGIAHGDERKINKINYDTLKELKLFMLNTPDSILERIVKISRL